jgi:hypothetical protein
MATRLHRKQDLLAVIRKRRLTALFSKADKDSKLSAKGNFLI